MIKVWDEILNTALIGIDKKQIDISIFSEDLKLEIDNAQKLTNEKEIQFLNSAAIVFNYRRAGYIPMTSITETIEICNDEQRDYCSKSSIGALHAILDDDNISLLSYWLNCCIENNLIVYPEFIPNLFQIAENNNELKEQIINCCGLRGQWLAQYNIAWKFHKMDSYQEILDHGRLDERKEALNKWRLKSASEARNALEIIWPQEQAATKAELLSTLEINLEKADEIFLKECWKEKSQKVKEVSLKLLKQIPSSFVIEEVWDFVKPLINIEKATSMMGLLNKEVININLSFEIPSHFKFYNISQLDANKKYNEKEYTLHQMIEIIPLTYWEKYLAMNAEAILTIFEKKENTKKYITAFESAVNTFKNKEWAILLYKKYQVVCYSVLPFFDRMIQEEIILTDVLSYRDLNSIFVEDNTEWSLSFSIKYIEKTAQQPYTFNKVFYKKIIHKLPILLIEKLDSIKISDINQSSYWENLKEEIKRLLTIKIQTIQSF